MVKRWPDGNFKEKPPLSVVIVLPLFFAVVLLDLAAWWSIPEWSPKVPDAVHSFPARFKGGTTFFVQPWQARAAHDADWLAFGLGAACFLLFWLHRDKLERIR